MASDNFDNVGIGEIVPADTVDDVSGEDLDGVDHDVDSVVSTDAADLSFVVAIVVVSVVHVDIDVGKCKIKAM